MGRLGGIQRKRTNFTPSVRILKVPNHCLSLKEDDICLIMRPMKANNLASNSRVRILKFMKTNARTEKTATTGEIGSATLPQERLSWHESKTKLQQSVVVHLVT